MRIYRIPFIVVGLVTTFALWAGIGWFALGLFVGALLALAFVALIGYGSQL